MSMSKIKVIWFDDEHETLDIIKEKAFLNDIELIGFGNAKDGISELEKNIKKYDAVILDGLFYSNREESGTTTSKKPFVDVVLMLSKLEPKKKLPWFILSGQPSFTKEPNEFIETLKDDQVYDKTDPDLLGPLWDNIKAEAGLQEETQIRHKYKDVFSACSKLFLGTNVEISLLAQIKLYEKEDAHDVMEALNGIRGIIEKLFGKLSELEIIPNGIINKNGWINQSSIFLSGKHSEFKWFDYPIHPTVAFLLYNILQISQDASHELQDKLTLKVKDFITANNTPYIYRSSLNQLFDILIWFSFFIEQNPDPELNRKLWHPITNEIVGDWIPGKVLRIAENGYGTFQPKNGGNLLSIIPIKVKEFNLQSNQPIEVIVKTEGAKTLIQNIRTL